jgi:predicted GNAT family acetyltransferase
VIEVKDNPEQNRFEIYDDGELAGFARYARRPGRLIFVHTEVDPAFEGRGLGGKLAAGALDAARAAGVRVVPLCPFIAHYIERNAQYADLVDRALMDQLESG